MKHTMTLRELFETARNNAARMFLEIGEVPMWHGKGELIFGFSKRAVG
jgi:hypothetical protein